MARPSRLPRQSEIYSLATKLLGLLSDYLSFSLPRPANAISLLRLSLQHPDSIDRTISANVCILFVLGIGHEPLVAPDSACTKGANVLWG